MLEQNIKLFFDKILAFWEDDFTPAQKIGAIILFILVFIGVAFSYGKSVNKEENKIKPALINNSKYPQKTRQPADSFIVVHIAGAVYKPGVYKLKDGDRVIDSIKKAGGAISKADLNTLNLASKLNDGQKVYVPKIRESAQQGNGNLSSQTEIGASNFPADKININTATKEDLDKLPGIGTTLAERIIEFRIKNGPFKSIDDLQNVEGIGEKKLSNIKEKATL